MTPERKKWWKSIPERKIYLYDRIKEIKKEIKQDKRTLNSQFLNKMLDQGNWSKRKILLATYLRIRQNNTILSALKHELERGDNTKIVVFRGQGFNIFVCQNCKAMLHVGDSKPNYKFCPWCGKKLRNKENQY